MGNREADEEGNCKEPGSVGATVQGDYTKVVKTSVLTDVKPTPGDMEDKRIIWAAISKKCKPDRNDGDGLYIDPQVLIAMPDIKHRTKLMRGRDAMRQENSRREIDVIKIEHIPTDFTLQRIMPPPSPSAHGNFNVSRN